MSKIKYRRVDSSLIIIIDNKVVTKEIKDEKFFDDLLIQINSYNGLEDGIEKEKLKDLIILKVKPPVVIDKDIVVSDKFKISNKVVNKQSDDMAMKDLEKADKIINISGKFEQDGEGRVFLEGFSVPIPLILADAILDANYNPESKYKVDSLVNFWQWAVLNPNPKARIDLFSWFETGEFVITDQGLIIAYRNVNVKKKGLNAELEEYINTISIKLKAEGKDLNDYAVLKVKGEKRTYCYVLIEDDTIILASKRFKGKLSDLYERVIESSDSTVYTDNHTGTMTIKMGQEVSMPRADCDEDNDVSCSSGLHFMSPSYGLRLGSTTLIVLVNPYNIVAFPTYDQTKGRCCAYLPVGKASRGESGEIVQLQGGSYDFDYSKYTSDELKKIIEEGNLKDLQERGVVSADLNENDFNIVKSYVTGIIKSRVINV